MASSTFNDRLLTINNPDFMPEIEKYVANQMITILQAYKAATATSPTYSPGIYPWADLSDGDSNASGSDYYNHWRFPCGTALPVDWNTTVPSSSPSTKTPVLPTWLTNGCNSPVTGWSSVIYYAVSKIRLENSGSKCSTCSSGNIKVSGANVDLVLITPGGYTGSPARNWPSSNFTTITGYFEDSANRNNDDTFVTPTETNYNRDRIYTIP